MSKKTRRGAVIAEEQRAVAYAYECLERNQAEASELSKLAVAASSKDAAEIKRHWGAKLASLDLGNSSLVFMRADVDAGGGQVSETLYIGRRAVFDEQRDPVVISWSAPAAIEWRQATMDEPGDVRLLRQVVCDERVVRSYFDLIRVAAPALAPSTDDVLPADSAEVEAAEWEDPLLAELDRARDGEMHDIVETIQREQLRLVADQPRGVLIVQGGPGTGKTAVGLHRVTWLLDNDHRAAGDLLVVGPNRHFLNYVGSVLPQLGTRGVALLELPALWNATQAQHDPAATRAVKSDSRMAVVLQRAVDHHVNRSLHDLESILGGTEFTFELNRREVVVAVREIAEIAERAFAGTNPYKVRREGCIQRVVDHLSVAYIGLLPGPADVDYFAEIRKLRPVTRLLQEICPEISAPDLLRRLFGSPETMANAASGVLTDEEQQALMAPGRGTASRPSAGSTPSREDLVCLDELEYLLRGRPERNYSHMVIDEAQDLTPMEARSIARRCPDGSMTVLGDLAQATGPQQYQSWDQLGDLLAGRDGWRLAELLTGFRVTQEVMDFAAPLSTACAPGVVVPVSVRSSGTEVLVHHAAEALGDAVARALQLQAESVGTRRSVAIIVPDGAEWERSARALLPASAQSAEGASPDNNAGPMVLPASLCKGLEFDHVLVVEPAAIAAQGPAGLRLLYVALTRCTQTLTVIHRAPLPAALTGRPRIPLPSEIGPLSGSSGEADPMAGEHQCSRFHADGTRCTATTQYPDRWCRQSGCGGFRTSEPLPITQASWLKPPLRGDDAARLSLTSDQLARVKVSSAAQDSFVRQHRGDRREAAVEIHGMLSGLIADGSHHRMDSGYWQLRQRATS